MPEEPPGEEIIGWFMVGFIAIVVYMVGARIVSYMALDRGVISGRFLALASFVLMVIIAASTVYMAARVLDIIREE